MSAPHTVLIGYGDTGRVAVATLPTELREAGVTVVDSDPDRARLATEDGLASVVGDGADRAVLCDATVHDAVHVIVAVGDDAAAMKVIAAVRRLTSRAALVVLLLATRRRELAVYLGADRVVVVDEVVGDLLGASVSRSAADGRSPLRSPDRSELVVTERGLHDTEIGMSPRECGPSVLAVVRAGTRLWLDDPAVTELRRDDRLVSLGPASFE